MSNLKLGLIVDEKPVKITAELSASTSRDLAAYAEALGRQTGQVVEPVQLVGPMLARFMATDRGFARERRRGGHRGEAQGDHASAPAPGSGTA